MKHDEIKPNEKKNVDDIIITNIEESHHSQSIKNYYFMHRRFAHFESKIFIKLHEVITHFSVLRLKHKKACFIYFIKKIKKKINHIITSKKNKILNLIFINAYKSLSKSLIENITFLKIIDNRLRKIWIIYIKNKKSISAKLDTWKIIIKLQIEKKLKVIRLNNALELLSFIKDWIKKYKLAL